MKINITSGQILNNILMNKYPLETFVPFNEAMIKGSYSNELFSDEFIAERARVHGVTVDSYKETMKDFLNFLKESTKYDEIVLWFGDEPFCRENRRVIIKLLENKNFVGSISLNIVNEDNGEILSSEQIKYIN